MKRHILTATIFLWALTARGAIPTLLSSNVWIGPNTFTNASLQGVTSIGGVTAYSPDSSHFTLGHGDNYITYGPGLSFNASGESAFNFYSAPVEFWGPVTFHSGGNGAGLTNVGSATNAMTATNWAAVFDVTAYGAVANGITDCHAAIEAAISNAIIVGGTVYFPARPGVTNCYLDSGPHTIYKATPNNYPRSYARPLVTLKGEPQTILLCTMTSGTYLYGYFNMDSLIVQGKGKQYGTWPYPTNYVGVFMEGPYGSPTWMRHCAVFGFGTGIAGYEGLPNMWDVLVRNCWIGIECGRQNDSISLDAVCCYNCFVGLDCGGWTPWPTNSYVPPSVDGSVGGSGSVRVKGAFDYNGIDIVLGGRTGSYEIQFMGESATNCNVMVGHDPTIWSALAALEVGTTIKAKLNTCLIGVNSPTNGVKLNIAGNLLIQASSFGATYPIHSMSVAGDASVVDWEDTNTGQATNLLTSVGHAITAGVFKFNCRFPGYYWESGSGYAWTGGPMLDNTLGTDPFFLNMGGIYHGLIAGHNLGMVPAGPAEWYYSDGGQYTWSGGTGGFQWNNAARNAALMGMDNSGNWYVAGAMHGNGSGITNVTAPTLNGAIWAPVSIVDVLAAHTNRLTYTLGDTALVYDGPLAAVSYAGSGAGVTNLNATNISGVLPLGTLTADPMGSNTVYWGDGTARRLTGNLQVTNMTVLGTITTTNMTGVPRPCLAGTAPATTTYSGSLFYPVAGYGAGVSTLARACTPVPSGTYSNFQFYAYGPTALTTNIVITVYTNGVATPITLLWSGNGGTYQGADTTHSVAVVAGTLMTVGLVMTNTEAIGVSSWSVQY